VFACLLLPLARAAADVRVPVTVLVPQTQPVVQTQILLVPVTVTPASTSASASTPVNRTSMVVCMGQEPASLAWWKTDLVSAHVLGSDL